MTTRRAQSQAKKRTKTPSSKKSSSTGKGRTTKRGATTTTAATSASKSVKNKKGGRKPTKSQRIAARKYKPKTSLTYTHVEQPTFMGRCVRPIMWNGELVEAVEGRYAYGLKPGATISHEEAEDSLRTTIFTHHEADPSGVGIFQTEPCADMHSAARSAMDNNSKFEWMHPVLLHYGSTVPNDEFFSEQWNLRAVNAPQAWDVWNGNSQHVLLAILDTGAPLESGQLSHPDLGDKSRILLGPDIVNNDPEPADDHGHGTHVLGIAGATINNVTGVAGLWPGRVAVIKVNDRLNRGSDENFRKGVARAIQAAQSLNSRLVINYSSTGPNSPTQEAAVVMARDANALVVAAVGNNFGGSIKFPAAFSRNFANVIAVGAVDRQRLRPSFANRGLEMTVVAPGAGILSTLPNYHVTLNNPTPTSPLGKQPKYDQLDGTSQAAPLVAALAALVWSQHPEFTAAQVRDKITQSADPVSGGDPRDFGAGVINARMALI